MMERLNQYTYEIRHSPNCPSPFLIVTCGDGGVIGRPGNLFSYGKSLDEAVIAAVKAIDDHASAKKQAFQHGCMMQRIFDAEWRVRGVVWA